VVRTKNWNPAFWNLFHHDLMILVWLNRTWIMVESWGLTFIHPLIYWGSLLTRGHVKLR
jgi:hypothetical protein